MLIAADESQRLSICFDYAPSRRFDCETITVGLAWQRRKFIKKIRLGDVLMQVADVCTTISEGIILEEFSSWF